jgi:multidrug efflux pump subunit AcrB
MTVGGDDGRVDAATAARHSDVLSQLVRVFLESNLSIILIVVALVAGAAALFVTPREEDPQIVVPLADVFVDFPGHSAAEVEQLVTTPLERILYQIDGVEYVYSMSQADRAVVTVRFYVGQDRERSLVKLFAKLGEHGDRIAPGVAGWVMKPVEIDDVPIVTLAVEHREPEGDAHALRRVAEELVERLSVLPNVSRAAVIGGSPRVIRVESTVERMAAYGVDPATVARAIAVSGTVLPAGRFTRDDQTVAVEAGHAIGSARDLTEIVVGVYDGRPVRLADVAKISDGPDEITDHVRHGWGPARRFAEHAGAPGTLVGVRHGEHGERGRQEQGGHGLGSSQADAAASQPAVTIAISKQRGSNAVRVAADVLARAEVMAREVLPDDMELVVTRNAGLTADEKVNELVEALAVALVIVVALLTVAMGWREAFVVAVAVPVVFGLTLVVNMLAGYTINRVTLFALILALGMLVDDPIVDVENIARHFEERKRATRGIVLDAVAEIRPPLISATLAVIVSFLPLFAITGMMGPYMSPMALGVPVAMAMSMLVAFTITPWLSYHVLGGKYRKGAGHEPSGDAAGGAALAEGEVPSEGLYDHAAVQQTLLYRIFRPLMLPLIRSKTIGYGFLVVTAIATLAAAGMGALRMVPLKMLPFDNKNELLLLVDMDEGTSLERTRAVVARLEAAVTAEPEVIDYTSHTGVAGPIDFNGLVRHYGLRSRPHEAEIRVNLVGKKHRRLQSHGLGLRMRDRLEEIGRQAGALVRIVELPPGPPVLSSIVAEVRGGPDASYEEILDAADLVAARMRREPAVVEVDTSRETPHRKLVFEVDQEKAALAGVSAADVAAVMRTALDGDRSQTVVVEGERNPLRVVVRLPEAQRSAAGDLLQLAVRSAGGVLVPVAEIGRFVEGRVDQTIHHKNLERLAYVTAECTSRPPAECVVDMLADQDAEPRAAAAEAAAVAATYLRPGSGIPWSVPPGFRVSFAGEGEWKITLDVFRDLGIAFGAALVMIYVILVAQTGSFTIPLVVMLAIPLTLLGVMPGFWLLDQFAGGTVGGHADPVYFTATAMIGMIALAGIVTRDSIILVDFIELAMKHGRSLTDAILESRVVRLRPILLTAGTAMLSALPITLDPIFAGLGWSLIFGLVASTLFTLFVIPISYRLLRG